MKKLFLTVLLSITITCPAFAGGITGGTTLNTTQRQRSEAQRRMDNQQCKDPGISQGTLDIGKKVVTTKVPLLGITDVLVDGMIWSAEKQRKLGGVPPTGSTVKKIK